LPNMNHRTITRTIAQKIDMLWQIYIDSFSDEHSSKWGELQNHEFNSVKKRLVSLIRRQLLIAAFPCKSKVSFEWAKGEAIRDCRGELGQVREVKPSGSVEVYFNEADSSWQANPAHLVNLEVPPLDEVISLEELYVTSTERIKILVGSTKPFKVALRAVKERLEKADEPGPVSTWADTMPRLSQFPDLHHSEAARDSDASYVFEDSLTDVWAQTGQNMANQDERPKVCIKASCGATLVGKANYCRKCGTKWEVDRRLCDCGRSIADGSMSCVQCMQKQQKKGEERPGKRPEGRQEQKVQQAQGAGNDVLQRRKYLQDLKAQQTRQAR